VTVSVVEVITPANVGAGVTSSIPITTTLVSSDLVVVLMVKNASGATTVSINGSTLSQYGGASLLNGSTSSGTRLSLFTQTGLTGSHSVSYDTNSFATTNQFTVYVIRGLSNPAITARQTSVWDNTNTTSGTDEGHTSVVVGADQIAISVGCVTSLGATVTFPSNATPSTGWTADRAPGGGAGNGNVIRQQFTSAGTVQVNIRATANVPIAVSTMIFGDATAATPLTSTFVGWGNPIF
jgi:hypothetical protein